MTEIKRTSYKGQEIENTSHPGSGKQKHIEDPVSEQIIADRMTDDSHSGATLRVSLSKDKEKTVVEWKQAMKD